MKKLIALVLFAGAAGAAVKEFLPDIQRYMRIRSM
jgi:hypothetical protein